MTVLLLMLLPCFYGATVAPVQASSFPYIPIYVENTWQLPYASDVQDICFDWQSETLVVRSNADGKLFLADPNNCEYIGEVNLPSGAGGFGVAVYEGEYYINSDTSPLILHSDETGTWSSFSNPAVLTGAGMDFNYYGSPDLFFEVSSVSPYQFYGIEPDGTDFYTYGLPGVNAEISGFMVHEVATLFEYPPSSVILTTRFGHEFFFYWGNGSGEYTPYGQEPCPLPVSESLGLTWSSSGAVYWSYLGNDEQYYISELAIPVFGGIEDDPTGSVFQPTALSLTRNPSTASASLSVNFSQPSTASLDVFDLSGRLVAVLHSGPMASGENIFGFTGSPGVYTAVLKYSGQEERLRFVLAR